MHHSVYVNRPVAAQFEQLQHASVHLLRPHCARRTQSALEQTRPDRANIELVLAHHQGAHEGGVAVQHLGGPEEGQDEAGPLCGQSRGSVTGLGPVQRALVPAASPLASAAASAGSNMQRGCRFASSSHDRQVLA